MADDTKAELENESGLEKSFSSCYLGKADVLLDNICLSKKIVLPISDINVKNIINSMRSRFDPSFIRLVLCPADESRFDPQQLRGNSYHVVQGCHSYLSLKSLDETGELASMTGLQFKRIPCIIINTTDPALLNYGNSRANDLASKFSKKPQIQDLVYVLQSLINHYVDVPRALETIMSYAIINVKDCKVVIAELFELVDKVMKMEKPEFSVIILFSSEECQRRVLSYMRSQKSDEQFVIYQLFFDAENRVVNGLHANLKFCIMFGRVKLFRKPLKSYYGDLSNLVKAVAAVSPPAAKVSCFAQPEMPIVSVHTTEDLSMKSFKYFGSTEAIKKFQEKLDKGALNGVQLADNHDDDASEPVVPVASPVDDTEQDNLLDYSDKMAF